jgi:acyl CoA:acetate/3-ketoacid CoA transferase alpha subunit
LIEDHLVASAQEWLRRFEAPRSGEDKVVPLDAAVRRSVRPGMALHFAFLHNRPTAAAAEVLRQFRGADPAFTLLVLFMAGPLVALLSEGLARRLVTSLVCEPYPAPGPSQAAQRAVASGALAIEHWSVLSYVARLKAAALGLPAMPVRMLPGSSIEADNAAHVRRRADVGGVVEVDALAPDLSFVHAPCADRFGNVLLAPPYGEGVWGACAAREGVVVTVERIVEPEVIARHSHLLGLPASRVRSVSVVPFGAHPAGVATAGIDGVEPYGDDVEHYAAMRESARTPAGLVRFVDEWLCGPSDHDAVLAKLGARRLKELKGKARPDSWRSELLDALAKVDLAAAPTSTERMICAAAGVLARKVDEAGHTAILSGLGAGNLAAWLAHGRLGLREEAGGGPRGDAPALVAELGLCGYTPRPCDPFLFNFRNLATCSMAADADTALGLVIGGARAHAVGSLGAAQVGPDGSFNSTRLADGTLLVGSGGACDVASGADEVVIVMQAARGRLVQRLPYVTGSGARVTAVVTDLGVLEKPRGAQALLLTRLVGPLVGGTVDSHVRELSARATFRIDVATELAIDGPADCRDVERLRLYDPERAFLGPLPGDAAA